MLFCSLARFNQGSHPVVAHLLGCLADPAGDLLDSPSGPELCSLILGVLDIASGRVDVLNLLMSMLLKEGVAEAVSFVNLVFCILLCI